MLIGVPKEILNNENRVAMTPAGAYTLKTAGHEVFIKQVLDLGQASRTRIILRQAQPSSQLQKKHGIQTWL